MVNRRYTAQTKLSAFSSQSQTLLSKARVLCIGTGGLGSPALFYLAAAGVGKLGVVDFDHVSLDNLNRQILFTEDGIGQFKSLLATKHLGRLNSQIQIQEYCERLTEENGTTIFSEYDYVIDLTDNMATKFLSNSLAKKLSKIFVCASVSNWEGQIAIFTNPKESCLECIYSSDTGQNIPSSSELGILGATAGIVGSLVAQEVVKLIIQSSTSSTNTLIHMELASLEIHRLQLLRSNDCVLCND